MKTFKPKGIRSNDILYLVRSRSVKNNYYIIREHDYHSESMINTVIDKGTRSEIYSKIKL